MSVAETVAEARAAAEELQTDTCVITADGAAEPVYDAGTDTYTYPEGTEVYDGQCRVKPADTVDLVQEAGEATVGARRYVLSLPAGTTGPRRNQSVLVTASELDPALPGTRLRILGVLKGSQLSARRLACEETSA